MSYVECAEHGVINCRDAACYTAPKPEPRPKPTGFRRAGDPKLADFDSECPACGRMILAGDPIEHDPDTGFWTHKEC